MVLLRGMIIILDLMIITRVLKKQLMKFLIQMN